MAGDMNELKKYMVVLGSVVILAMIIPSIGSTIETAMPVNSSSSFNGVTTGGELYSQGLVAVLGVVGICGIIIILKLLGINLFGGKN